MKPLKCLLMVLAMVGLLFVATDAQAQCNGFSNFGFSQNFSFGQPVFAQPVFAQPVFAGPFLTQPAFISSPVVVRQQVIRQNVVQPQVIRQFRGVFGAQRQVIRNF